jgi:hypothetical protein
MQDGAQNVIDITVTPPLSVRDVFQDPPVDAWNYEYY